MRTKTNSRRKFMGAMMMGATASTISMFTNPLTAHMPEFSEGDMDDAEKWFDKIKGSHRVVYDGSQPHNGFPIIWNWAFYLSNNETGSADSDITAMTVLRHNAIPFALPDSLWKKYKFGEVFNVKKADGSAYERNPYYEPQEGDFPMPVIQGIKDLQARGALFCVCNLALHVVSGMVASKMGLEANAVYEEWNGHWPGLKKKGAPTFLQENKNY